MRVPVRVLVVSSHVVQYDAPLYRRCAQDVRIGLTVAYCSLHGAQPGIDPGLGVRFAWDVPLLEGYSWVAPPNRSLRPGIARFWGLVNPALWRLIARRAFDVVVCHGYHRASFWIAGVAARRAGCALATFTDGTTLRSRSGRGARALLKRAIVPRLYGACDGVFARSTRAVRYVRGLGIPAERVFLVPYVVDTEAFAAAVAATRSEDRPRTGSDAKLHVLFVGKLVPWKRAGDLLEAAAAFEQVRVTLAGDGPLREDLERRACALGMRDRVHFAGFVNQTQLPPLYAAADVLVLPSSFEPFGQVVAEAFACGTPVLASTACGAVDDLIAGHGTGAVFEPGDVRALRSLLEELSREPRRVAAMGERALTRIARWGPEAYVGAFVQACLALERQRRPKAAR